MQDYSLALALFDYLPVVVSALGLYWLARLIGATDTIPAGPPLLAVVLIIGGGLCKASWKLWWVLTGNDLVSLANMLFILMAPGMVLLAMYCHAAQRCWRGDSTIAHPGRITALVIALVYGASFTTSQLDPLGRGWFFLLLACASLANITISALLIRFAWLQQQTGTALIFAVSILLILSLSALARISAGSAPLQWLAEILNLLAHGTFALAVWRLQAFIPKPTTPV